MVGSSSDAGSHVGHREASIGENHRNTLPRQELVFVNRANLLMSVKEEIEIACAEKFVHDKISG